MHLTRRTGELSTGEPIWVNHSTSFSFSSKSIGRSVAQWFHFLHSPIFFLSGHLEVVKLLVSSGAEVDCKDKKAYTPLHAAASSGMSSTVHYLLSLGVNVSAHKQVHEQWPHQ